MTKQEILQRIANHLIGIDKADLTTAENSIAQILVANDICEWNKEEFKDYTEVHLKIKD